MCLRLKAMSLIETFLPDAVKTKATGVTKSEKHAEATCDESQGSTKIQRADQKKVGYGLLSPSPRGIETWGPCSPFILPDPSTQITFIEPEEISLVLDGHSTGTSGVDTSNSENAVQILPSNGFMDLETILEATELPFPVSGRAVNENILHSNLKVDDPCLTDSEENTKFIEDFFLQLKPDTTTNKGVYEPKSPTKAQNVLLNLIHGKRPVLRNMEAKDLETTENRVFCVQEFQKLDLPITQGVTSGRKICRRTVGVEGKAEKCQGSRTQVEFQFSPKENDDGTADRSKEKLISASNKSGTELSEEELKRIRRVKNRASVEKCRTKQRLRMEALQSELKTLTSENNTLRDLTTWMDSSVDVISSQLAETGQCRENAASSSSSAGMG